MATGTGTPQQRDAVTARVSLPFAEGAPGWLMWMPGGTHEITASRRGQPITLTMAVGPEDAAAMQRSLRDHLAGGRQRPFFDFDHSGGAASAWPVEFAWREAPEPGIWARVEWSDAGRAAVAGKTYRAFSPKWYPTASHPAHIESAPLNMGGLVNDPAFREISPIWASSARQSDNSVDPKPMNDTEKAALQARIVELETQKSELEADAAGAEKDAALEAAAAEKAALAAENAKLKEAAEARARRDADACIASAVSRGAIAPKDEAGQDKWRKLILADPANAELLAKQPGKPALTAGRITRSAVELIKADTNDILRGYIAAATPRDKGMIYHRELSPLIAKGENVLARYPVEATNALGTVANAIVSQRVLELVVSKRPMLNGVVMDFSDEVKSKGDTVTTRTIGLPTAQNFGTAATDTADTDVVVTLDLFKQVLYSFTAAEIVGTSRNLVAERSEALAIALGNSMVDALAALINETNFGTVNQTILATASVDFSTLVAINQAMNTAGVPQMGRFGWVNSAVAAALSNDQLVTEYIDKTPITEAYAHWRNIKGFANIWEFPALPANSVNLTGFFASRSALVVATRIPRNPTEMVGANYPGTMQVVTDPVTGYSVLRNEWIDPSTWAVNSRLVTLYGVDLGNAAVGHTLVSA